MNKVMGSIVWVVICKGLFELWYDGGGWWIVNVSFFVELVSMVLFVVLGGCMLVVLNLGYFGIKMYVLDDGGWNWIEVVVFIYLLQFDGVEGLVWKFQQVWLLECGVDQVIWVGMIFGGLFCSDDGGVFW